MIRGERLAGPMVQTILEWRKAISIKPDRAQKENKSAQNFAAL
jgi:hypothetical protein